MKDVLKKLKEELKTREKQVKQWQKELAQELRNNANEVEQGFNTVGFLQTAIDKVRYILRVDSRICTLRETIRMMEAKEG